MHSRIRPTTFLPIEDLKTDLPNTPDKEYIRLYQKSLTGKIKVALTRVHQKDIIGGYFYRKSDGSVSKVQNLRRKLVPTIMRSLKAGNRYSIDLYWNQHTAQGGGYVCPDDEVTLEAYRQLGIDMVPCRILKPNRRRGPHGSLWLENQKKQIRLAKEISPIVASVQLFSSKPEHNFSETIMRRIDFCRSLQAEIRKFHIDGDQYTNYHHFLHAVVDLHCDALDTILRLTNLGRAQHALSVFRMAYEGYLNFYIDWLAPEFVGPRKHLHSAANSANNQKTKAIAEKALANFSSLFSSTSRKARLSPLPDLYHEVVYSRLSSVVHQSYEHIERHSLSFEKVHDRLSCSEEKELGRWIDLVTASLAMLISNEIGKPTTVKASA